VVVTVKSARKRIKKYKDKLELPNPVQVYHTALKTIKCYEYVNYQVNPGCVSYLEYIALNYALSKNLGVVARGVLVRLVRHAFSDYLEAKKISSDTKRRCYKWLGWLNDYVDICYNFWLLINSALLECGRIVCLPDIVSGVDSEIIEKGIRLYQETVLEGIDIRGYT